MAVARGDGPAEHRRPPATRRGRVPRKRPAPAPHDTRRAAAASLVLILAGGPVALAANDAGTDAGTDPADVPAAPVGPRQSSPPVAVASSLRFAWPALVAAMDAAPVAPPERSTVRETFGASLALAAQMLAGAPFELLVAADAESVQRLVAGGLVDASDVARYADGRLALAVRPDSPLGDAPTLEALAARLRAEPGLRIAIPNPDSAPYGRAAVEALAAAGLGDLAPSRVARGENAGQALQFLLAGAVDAALVPQSLVTGAPAGTELRSAPVDARLHAPIEHALGLVRDASEPAARLARFLRSCEARAVLESEGFAAPAGVACTAYADADAAR